MMNLENTKVYTTDKEVIRKYAELCGGMRGTLLDSIEDEYCDVAGYSCSDFHGFKLTPFDKGSTIDNLDKFREIKPEQINALYAEKFGIKTETPEESEALDAIAQVDSEEWDGEGLPPVGVECELSNCGNEWQKAKVLFVGTGLCVVDHGYGDQHYHLSSVKFRKPETPQQREERERLEAAYDLYCDWCQKSKHSPFPIEKMKEYVEFEFWLDVANKISLVESK